VQKIRKSLLAIALFSGSAASAETLTISGWYAAEVREVAMLDSLAVDRFDGDDGPELGTAIERALGDVQDRDGGPYFTIRSRYAEVDGMVNGAVRVRVESENFKRKVKRCASDTKSTKCDDKDKIEIEIFCKRRFVNMNTDIKVIRLADDATVFNRAFPQRKETETCEGDRAPETIDPIVSGFIRTTAEQFAGQVVPYGRTEKIRVRESRSGLGKVESNQMKALITLTKKDEAAACKGWADMEARGVNHPTLKFNLGLCAEMSGRLDMALGYYEPLAAASRNASDVNDGIGRVERRMAGEADDSARNKGL
jgi:hypothetical protein